MQEGVLKGSTYFRGQVISLSVQRKRGRPGAVSPKDPLLQLQHNIFYDSIRGSMRVWKFIPRIVQNLVLRQKRKYDMGLTHRVSFKDFVP